MVACRQDNFSAKVPGLLPAADATNVYYHNRRAVSIQWRKTSDSIKTVTKTDK